MSQNILLTGSKIERHRMLVWEWFLDNFQHEAIMRLRTTHGDVYMFWIEQGFTGLRGGCLPMYIRHLGDACFLRKAFDVTRKRELAETCYVGLRPSTWTFEFFRADLRAIQTTSPLAELVSIKVLHETVT